MSEPRLASSITVSALIRRVETEGGFAVVAARGDSNAGAILIIAMQRGEIIAILERALTSGGNYSWNKTSGQLMNDKAVLNDYLARKRRNDPDLWLVEADVPDVERFIAQLSAAG